MTSAERRLKNAGEIVVRARRVLPVLALSGIAAGGAAWWLRHVELGQLLWATTTAVVLIPLALGVMRDLVRARFGVDIIALLAMAGALLLGQDLAGAVIALMLSGGQTLEQFANGRARRELTALLQRAPREAHRYRYGTLETIPIEAVEWRSPFRSPSPLR
jgi:cation transport ATPase